MYYFLAILGIIAIGYLFCDQQSSATVKVIKISPALMDQYMKQAIELSRESGEKGGGPFGAVVVSKEGKILGYGHNRVAIDNDPTAHGEVSAIRDATKKQQTFDLKGAILFTSTYPCSMCFSAAHWANISTIYYANTADDVSPEFDDSQLWHDIQNHEGLLQRTLPMPAHRHDATLAFQEWKQKVQSGSVKDYNPKK